MTLRIGGGAGFLGDQLTAPRRLVESAELDVLTLEYLAELTMSILARRREQDPAQGYAADFLAVLESLLPALARGPALQIVTNAGGVNPLACVRAAARLLCQAGQADVPLGLVEGDDLLPRIDELLAAGLRFEHFDTGEPLGERRDRLVSAHAYLGGVPIAAALRDGARHVIAGRVADAALTLGPALARFGWQHDAWNLLAGASVAGHLIECGSQLTGAYSTRWRGLDLAHVGYPIAELDARGNCVVTKPAGTGGRVDRHSVCEQLVYEIGDPREYATPDVTVDFSTVEVDDLGNDRVAVSGATGHPPPASYKLSLAYRDGFTAAGQMLVWGDNCVDKARATAEIVLERLRASGSELAHTHVELLGTGAGVPGVCAPRADALDPPEVVLRVAVRDARRAAVEQFVRQWAPLATSGPAGLAGYTAATTSVRPVFAYWPSRSPRELVSPRHEVRSARDWCEP